MHRQPDFVTAISLLVRLGAAGLAVSSAATSVWISISICLAWRAGSFGVSANPLYWIPGLLVMGIFMCVLLLRIAVDAEATAPALLPRARSAKSLLLSFAYNTATSAVAVLLLSLSGFDLESCFGLANDPILRQALGDSAVALGVFMTAGAFLGALRLLLTAGAPRRARRTAASTETRRE
ncbi:MAG: hypothetical protein L0Z55_04800 [Planctomycetes bacterium]|nr:hypothetical protein [Planctomycetota bacterium]